MSIVWGGRDIVVGDKIAAPSAGRFQVIFISCRPDRRHGVDIDIPGGGITLSNGDVAPTLRIWCPPEPEPIFEYEYRSPKDLLHVTTVYEVTRGGRTVVERWTGNAAMHVERTGTDHHVYHCSHADSTPPDFEDMVFSLTTRPEPA